MSTSFFQCFLYIILSMFFVHHSFSVFCTSFFQCFLYIILSMFFVHHSFNVFCISFFQCFLYIILSMFFVHHSFNVFCISFFQCFCTFIYRDSSHLCKFTIFIPFFIFISIFRMHLPLQNPFYFAHYLDKLIYSTKIF